MSRSPERGHVGEPVADAAGKVRARTRSTEAAMDDVVIKRFEQPDELL
jgi:hypothetical protein